MIFRSPRNIAQSTIEYAIVLAIVAGALVAMQVYLKRGLQGRIKNLADQISPTHYESGRTDSSYTTVQSGSLVEKYNSGIVMRYQDGTDGSTPEQVTRSGYEQITPEESTVTP